jgi:hypothetical protein
MVEMRTCTKCGVPKPLDHLFFAYDKRGHRGFRSQCKECCNNDLKNRQASKRQYRQTHQQELLDAPLAAAVECLKQNPRLVKLVADFDSTRFRDELSKIRRRVLSQMEERHRIQSEQAHKGWATRRATSATQTVAR